MTRKDRLEASWRLQDRKELEEARALIADLHGQLDAANTAAVRMAQLVWEATTPGGPKGIPMTPLNGDPVRFLRG